MADLHAPTELKVTTGAIRGSKKIQVPAAADPAIKVAMREIALEPSSGEAPVRVYDTSGPYTDAAAPDVLDLSFAASLPLSLCGLSASGAGGSMGAAAGVKGR